MNSPRAVLLFFQNTYARHLSFVIFFFLLFFVLISVSENPMDKIFSGSMLCLFYLLCIYCGRWLIKRWYKHSSIIQFCISFIAMTILLSAIGALGGASVFNWAITTSFFWYFSICIPIVILFSGFGMFLTLGRKSFADVQLSREHKERELEFLRSQLSPHFLFNTLNNLYGLAITQPALMPPLLLRLSDLLRYSVYDARETQVMLQEEVNYIRNYIELERIRLGERLQLSLNLDSGSVRIPPMLLVTFVENAFKHGGNTVNSQIRIDVNLYFTEHCLHFEVINSFHKRHDGVSVVHSGVGLQNAIKRLRLIYPNKFSLDSGSHDGYYTVKLKLELK